jgi:hypothetical protein
MDRPVEFVQYSGDLMDLEANETHLVFRWMGPGKILFSVSRRGNAASCHFASNNAGLRYIKEAIDAFVKFVFWIFDWCTMVLAQVEKPSVGRLIKKVGFMPIGKSDNITVYARVK